ncbi:MAG: phenylalanine--tRNA ligase beta subunit-related protein [Dehalobacter sp.]|nr:phenylalanine--tRNA ligase beta subunit-related protein [Dehalobacter sp.]
MDVILKLNNDVLTKYPDFKAAFCLVKNFSDHSSQEERTACELKIVEETKNEFSDNSHLSDHPFGQLYSEFYRGMGLKPKKVSTPIQQVERVIKTGAYRSIHKIIDICMEVEYTSLISFQVYDADTIVSPMIYRFSDGREMLTTFSSDIKACKPGELILVDHDAVLHSSYYGNNVMRSIKPQTTNFLVRAMCIPGIAYDYFMDSMNRFMSLIPITKLSILANDSTMVNISSECTRLV